MDFLHIHNSESKIQSDNDFNLCEVPVLGLEQNHQIQTFQAHIDEILHQLNVVSSNLSDIIKRLLENSFYEKSTLFSGLLGPQEKSLLFSLLALMQISKQGVLVVVSPNHQYLKEQLWRVNSRLSWVAINNQVSQTQRDKITTHLESGGFKLIFIHPDLLHQTVVHNVDLIVFDDPQSYLQNLPYQNQIWKVDFLKTINDFKPKNILILVPFITMMDIKCFIDDCDNYQFNFLSQTEFLQNKMILKWPLTVSKDEDHLQHLVQLLRSPRLLRRQGIIIFCLNKYQIEETHTFLAARGVKCATLLKSFTEQKKQNLFFDFAKGYQEVLIVPSGTLFPQGFRHFINLTIHLYLPLTIENFLYDIQEINPEGNSHVFLNTDTFMKGRNKITAEMIQPGAIEGLIKLIYPYQEQRRGIDENKTDLNKIQSIQFNIQQKASQLKITKDIVIELVEILLKQKYIKDFCVWPIEIMVKISNKFDSNIQFIEQLIRCSRKCIQTNLLSHNQDKLYRCSIKFLSIESNLTPKEIMMNLKELQFRKQLSYSVCEENICINVASDYNMEQKQNELYHHFQQKTYKKLENYDTLYKILSVQSFQSLDYMWRQVKLKQIDYNNLFLDALNHCQSDKLQVPNSLPFLTITSQREKSNFLSDVQIIKQSLLLELDPKWLSQTEKLSFANDCLIILQGLEVPHNQFNNWKSSNLWRKYQKYQYEALNQIIIDNFNQVQVESLKNSCKKVKLNESRLQLSESRLLLSDSRCKSESRIKLNDSRLRLF